MSFKVTKVIDGDTFTVNPTWEWKMKDGKVATGDTVRIAGINTPEKGQTGYEAATKRLKDKIEGKNVELENAVNLSYGRVVCDVYLNGTKVTNY